LPLLKFQPSYILFQFVSNTVISENRESFVRAGPRVLENGVIKVTWVMEEMGSDIFSSVVVKSWMGGMDWIDLAQDRDRVAGPCENSN